MGWFSLLAVILVGVFYTAIWYFFVNFKNEAAAAGLPPEHVFFKFLAQQQSFMNGVFLISAIFAVIIVCGGGLFLSHKVAGPLYRLTQHLKNSNKASGIPVKFRNGDYFMEIQDAFNEFIKK